MIAPWFINELRFQLNMHTKFMMCTMVEVLYVIRFKNKIFDVHNALRFGLHLAYVIIEPRRGTIG